MLACVATGHRIELHGERYTIAIGILTFLGHEVMLGPELDQKPIKKCRAINFPGLGTFVAASVEPDLFSRAWEGIEVEQVIRGSGTTQTVILRASYPEGSRRRTIELVIERGAS